MQKSFSGRAIISTVTIGIAAFLLLFRLGHQALWDDEALTALYAQGVVRTGDTPAELGHNLVAYRQGVELRNLRERLEPPLQFYVAAPFLGLLGNTAFAARLPFALCGLATVILLFAWLWKSNADLMTMALWAMGILGNVSFFLFCRNARYYALVILASLVMTWFYLRRDGIRRKWLWLSLAALALFAANYLCYFAVNAALLVDYLVWERKRKALHRGDWLWLLVPQLLGAAVIGWVWNPLGLDPRHNQPFHNWTDRLTIFFWNWRDLNNCEFGALILILLAPLLYRRTRDNTFLRAPLALLVFVLVLTCVSPQRINTTTIIQLPGRPSGLQTATTTTADIRYLVPVIPLCLLIEIGCLRLIKPGWLALLSAGVVFGTNLLNGGMFSETGWRSTAVGYAGELAHPPDDPYLPTARWISANVAAGQSIFVLRDYNTYPLMFHAPDAQYAWQLAWPPAPQFAHLPTIHFMGKEPPDYLVAFGPGLRDLNAIMQQLDWPGVKYAKVATIDTLGEVLYKPDLHDHVFRPATNFDRATQAVYIFKRVSMPATNSPAASSHE